MTGTNLLKLAFEGCSMCNEYYTTPLKHFISYVWCINTHVITYALSHAAFSNTSGRMKLLLSVIQFLVSKQVGGI